MDGPGTTSRQADGRFPGPAWSGQSRYLLMPDMGELDLAALAVEHLDRRIYRISGSP